MKLKLSEYLRIYVFTLFQQDELIQDLDRNLYREKKALYIE